MAEIKYCVPINDPLPGQSSIYRHPKAEKGLIWSPDPEKIKTLRDNILQSAEKHGNNNFLGTQLANGNYEWKNYKTCLDIANKFGSGLIALNLVPPISEYKDYEMHLFGICSKNREEYLLADIGAILYGLTSVPIYDTLGAQSVEFILEQTKMSTYVGAEDNIRKFVQAKKYGYIKNIISFEKITDEKFREEAQQNGLTYYSFDDILQAGHEKPQKPYPLTPQTIYVISYTSGTTGNPKGALLTHANYVSLVAFGMNSLNIVPNDVYLSYLPLAHVFERIMITMLIYNGCAIGFFRGDITKIKDDFQALRPTILATVPRLLNRFHDAFKSNMQQLHGVKGWLARRALATKLTNLQYYGNIHHWIHDKIIFSKMRQALGGRLRWIVIGSAPTSKETLDFMKVALCIPIQEGYGQTESTGASFVMHTEDHFGSGCVGGPGVNTEFKLTDVPEMSYTSLDKDEKGKSVPRGEMCIRGPGVFAGYYMDEEKTKEAIDEEGWLHTGDICQLNYNGSIKIIDRKKNIFKMSQGEYIAPEKLENIFNKCKSVAEIFVYGDALESFLIAVTVVNLEALKELAIANGINEKIQDILNDKKVKLLVLNEMKTAGAAKKLSGFEYVKNIHLEAEPFASKDLITTTFKLKRFEARKIFIDIIAGLYKEGPLIH